MLKINLLILIIDTICTNYGHSGTSCINYVDNIIHNIGEGGREKFVI